MSSPLILASGSEIRAKLLANAGLRFDVEAARVDESAILASLQACNAPPRDMADTLAEAKARKVSSKRPGALVLGCDQVLALDGEIFQKPRDDKDAMSQLTRLAGQKHHLLSAAVIYQDGQALWRHVALVRMHMRALTPEQIGDYVARNWAQIRHCVGCYKIEQEGIGLFNRIEGDIFAVQGLPLLEILGFLRTKGATPI